MNEEASPPPLWGVQYLHKVGDGYDWFDWEPHEELCSSVSPMYSTDEVVTYLRFATSESAEQHLNYLVDYWDRKDQARRAEFAAAAKLRRARIAALKEASLWLRPGEYVDDVIQPVPGPPRRVSSVRQRRNWRVVPDREMQQPAVHHKTDCECDLCFFGEPDIALVTLHLPAGLTTTPEDHDLHATEWALWKVRVVTEPVNPDNFKMPTPYAWGMTGGGAPPRWALKFTGG